ncbi:amidase [Pleomassaria siparia CBS 279.74]|uniref:Amidase n=1 Tax=Pleomassaria siparia CBS 279.74 TaxID=1314801 RepID=A0A6G1KDV2_9PLEO|nr:amidase [Pleomassaria siparia CBS 279.74]
MPPILGDYQSIGAQKRAQRSNKIPKEWLVAPETFRDATNVLQVPVTCGVLSDVECDITSDHDATALVEKLKAGVWSAEQVSVAFCKRAAIAQQLVNCLTEIFFDEAIERARYLDRKRRANPDQPLPPLWGLPISLKDSFDVLGHDSSTGLACYVGEPAQEHSSLAAMLLDLGAVLYCKTNLPQSIMTADSDNNVFGRTLNPQNTALTAGGSTGGEGALIALRGSILGVGTDIGGSIRVPSVCNGIYGFRPSVGLIPHSGVRDLTVPGTDGVRSSAGPMATSIRDCALFLKSIEDADTWRYDSTVISLPWRNLAVKEKLRIGLVDDDGIYTPSPPVRRGLRKAADLLRDSTQVELVPITLPNVKDHYHDLLGYWSVSGSDHYFEQFARTGEPEVPSLKAIQLLSFKGTTLKGFFDLNVRRAAAAKQYLKLFLDNEIDAILMPPAPHTAVPLDTWITASYTGLFNFLDYPAIVVPVDSVRDEDAADDVANAKYGPDDAKVYSLYTGPKLYKCAPVCVQVVGYRHADEALLNTATLLDSIINHEG